MHAYKHACVHARTHNGRHALQQQRQRHPVRGVLEARLRARMVGTCIMGMGAGARASARAPKQGSNPPVLAPAARARSHPPPPPPTTSSTSTRSRPLWYPPTGEKWPSPVCRSARRVYDTTMCSVPPRHAASTAARKPSSLRRAPHAFECLNVYSFKWCIVGRKGYNVYAIEALRTGPSAQRAPERVGVVAGHDGAVAARQARNLHGRACVYARGCVARRDMHTVCVRVCACMWCGCVDARARRACSSVVPLWRMTSSGRQQSSMVSWNQRQLPFHARLQAAGRQGAI